MNSSKQPIGYKLTAAREDLSLSIEDVVSILKIKQKTIQALEEDAYPNQVIDIFTKGQLVSYCKLLKIEPQIMLNTLEAKGYDFQSEATVIMKKSYILPPKYKKICMGILALLAFIWMIPESHEEKATFTQPLIQDYNYEY